MSKTITDLVVLYFGSFVGSFVRDSSQVSSPNVTHPVVTSLVRESADGSNLRRLTSSKAKPDCHSHITPSLGHGIPWVCLWSWGRQWPSVAHISKMQLFRRFTLPTAVSFSRLSATLLQLSVHEQGTLSTCAPFSSNGAAAQLEDALSTKLLLSGGPRASHFSVEGTGLHHAAAMVAFCGSRQFRGSGSYVLKHARRKSHRNTLDQRCLSTTGSKTPCFLTSVGGT